MSVSRIPGFYQLSVADRVRVVHERGLLTDEDYQALRSGAHTLTLAHADKMIENVIGVMGLPIGLGLNFLVNGRDHLVPLVVEEPSIVAALSSAAKLARESGGFTATLEESLLIGQVQAVEVPHPTKAKAALLQRREEILNLANSLHPKMVARGGGAKEIEVHTHTSATGDMVVLHLLVDTCDAMGANLVNTMCEGIASLVETITGGKVFLRILSNLTDRSVVRARVVIPTADLAGKGYDGEQVRDGIVIAAELAAIDPYRAATHNKGIMNGIDAVALATGNDWRAIEAAAHAYAARGSRYTSLTRWEVDENGDLAGSIEVPIKVGTVGGPLESNPTVALNLRLCRVRSARELAELMGAVGLAQNFSALRALVTEGIQEGHMTLHARSVALAAGATPDVFDSVVEKLVDSGEIKIWKAKELLEEVRRSAPPRLATAPREATVTGTDAGIGVGHGKAILLGEHGVVYGRHGVVAPIPLAIRARVQDAVDGVDLFIPSWNFEMHLHEDTSHSHVFQRSIALILERLGLTDRPMRIEVVPSVPRAMGLGGSAAVAVAIIRALDAHFRFGLTDEQVNDLAFACETIAHGTPSGIDNTIATFGRPLLFRGGERPVRRFLEVKEPIPAVIGMSGVEGLTAVTVARVRRAWENNPALYERIFDEMDQLALQAAAALEAHDLPALGELMNVGHGLLNALQVSTWELEELVQIARAHGALGAKLTGGGGGGSIVAVCPDDPARVVRAMQDAGYQALEVRIG